MTRTRLKFTLRRRTAQVVERLGKRGGGKQAGIGSGIETGSDPGSGTAKAKTAIGRAGIATKTRDIANAIPTVREITTVRETGIATRSEVTEIKIANGRGNETAVAAGSSAVRRRRKSTALRLHCPSTTSPQRMHSVTPAGRLATTQRRRTSAYRKAYRHQLPLYPRAS